MIKTDEDALICDLAQIYHIYDYRQLPLIKVAVFAYGLPDNSRIKMILSKLKIPLETMLLAQMVDALNLLFWSKTTESQKGNNRPKSIFSLLIGEQELSSDVSSFESVEAFEEEKLRILREIEVIDNGN